jgi:serine/threonine protein kinase
MKEPRWQKIAESEFPWEREALEFVREKLPDNDPYFAWSNFEFIAADGTINEVDLLVLTPAGLFLVEIKSGPGLLRGDAATWVWENDGKVISTDNPLYLANRKAKKLASLLKRQKAVKNIKFPYLDALILCSSEALTCQLQGTARTRLCFRDATPARSSQGKGIIGALVRRDYDGAPNLSSSAAINRPTAKAVCAAVEEAGVKPSQKSRRVGDYLLRDLLNEDSRGNFQDWRAEHSKIPGDRVRVRIYGYRKNAPTEELEGLKRAALREYNLGSNLAHPGILQVRQYTETEYGPAVIFHHPGESQRLDHYLQERGEALSLDQRLNLIRQIAEAVKFAHEKRVIHRALSPQSVLIDNPNENFPKVRIYNWQTGSRFAKGTSSFEPALSPTAHPEELIEEISTVYLAPEAGRGSDDTGEHLDIFSLGAIAFHILYGLYGKPPATTVQELNEKLKRSKGLQISSVLNGAGAALQKFIRESTNPEVLFRTETVVEFLGNLDRVEEELTRPDDVVSDQPLEAKVVQMLEGGLTVKGKLGTGASAVAFLVENPDKKELVLKLANDAGYNDRLREEAEVVSGLNHQNIVRFVNNFEIGGLAGFLMNLAGTETLTQRLHREGRLQIEFLQRFGEELLSAVKYLEDMGVHHRDIKPDNIGIGPRGKDGKLSLTLFDFSLSRTSVDHIKVGTTHYLDPFLPDRKRWDLAAERFSAAVVLYEMATGLLPKWGDGLSRPDLIEGKPNIEAELFDPGLREPMVEFFTRAFQPDAALRFDNAEEMDREWRNIFAGVEPVRDADESLAFDAAALDDATLDTPVSDLGLSLRASSALNRINILTVRDVMTVNPRRLRRYLGVGSQTRRELVELQDAARAKFGSLPEIASAAPDSASQSDAIFANRQATGVDQLAKQVRETAGREKAVGAVARGLLGLEDETAGAAGNGV